MMDERHRRILRANRTRPIENIANPIDVVDLLYERGLFTESMKQDVVEGETTQNARVRKILDIVPKRGPNAFTIFYQCLLDTHNNFAADLLKPEQDRVELPQDWPDEAAMTEEIRVRPCEAMSELVRDNWKNPCVYSVEKRSRGHCLILSNEKFHGSPKGLEGGPLSQRLGNDKDVTALTKLFDQLQFDVRHEKDLTAEDMHRVLSAESAHQDHQSADCFVCIICSHGTNEGIYGTDGNIISIDDVTKYFDGEHCPPLRQKPKLFFIQACRGETADTPGHTAEETHSGPDLSNLIQQMRITDENDSKKDATDTATDLTPNTGPTKADMLVACATHAGYVSVRNIVYGSWFIQAVIYVFKRYAYKEDIFGLLTLVNNLVARGRTPLVGQGDRPVMQASQYTTSLLKKFFFFPGMSES